MPHWWAFAVLAQNSGQLIQQQTHWKRPWCWIRLKAEEEGDRGWEGWMVSPIQWTWTWANSRIWWGTGKPSVLQSMGFAKSWTRLGNWTTTLKWALLHASVHNAMHVNPRLKSPTLLLEPSSSPLIPVAGGQPPPLFYNHKAHVISVRLTHFKTHPQSWMP